MRAFIHEYGLFIAECIVGLALIAALVNLTYGNVAYQDTIPELMSVTAGNNSGIPVSAKPQIEVFNAVLENGAVYDPMAYVVSAVDADGNDLTDKVIAINADKVDTLTAGEYTVRYRVSDEKGLTTRIDTIVTVKEAEGGII